jgi:thymidylate synthase (FAD)
MAVARRRRRRDTVLLPGDRGNGMSMEVQLLEATDDPERVICTAARNDYMESFVGDLSFEEAMSSIEGETIEEKKRTLIGHLLDHGHFGPFEHPQATFAIKGISRSCMAQITRHRHVSFDVRSMRYVSFDDVDPADVAEGELVVTPPSATDPDWIGRNQRGGSVDEETVERREEVFRESVRRSVEEYQELLDLGMPPEDARFVLPIGTEVNMIMSMNARMLMHVADMRAAADSQWEIRQMTESVLDLAEEWCPITFEHYDEHMRNRKNRLAP